MTCVSWCFCLSLLTRMVCVQDYYDKRKLVLLPITTDSDDVCAGLL